MASSRGEDLALLAEAAHEAAKIAMGFFRRDPKVWWKEGNSPVSEADFAVDTFLKETLLGARPDYGWVSEETEMTEARADRFFVVDPIDGTRAFLRGEDSWCVSVAVVEAGRPIAGVIDAPAMQEVFTAEKDGRPMLNGKPFAVSTRPGDGRLHLSIPESFRRKLGGEALGSLRLAGSMPSLAYRLALVAAGRLDGTLIRPRANDWDIAAGDLLLERAGGALVDLAGEPRLYKMPAKRHGLLVAGAGHALDALKRLAAATGDA